MGESVRFYNTAAAKYTEVSTSNPLPIIAGFGADSTWQYSAAVTVNTDTVVRASAGAALRNYITDITLGNSSAAAVRVDIKDGTTVIWSAWVPAGATIQREFKTALRGSVATAVNVNVNTATTTMLVSLSGYVGI